jgi:16S rRNA G966 N2-methylase RsmD
MSNSDLRCACCGEPITAIRSTRRYCDEHCRIWAHRHPGEVPSWAPAVRAKALQKELKKAARIEREKKAARRVATQAARQANTAARAALMSDTAICGNYDVRCLSVSDIPNRLPKGGIDWVITDPPYPEEYLPLYSDLSRAAAHMLKPGGHLVVMTGHMFLEEQMRRLSEHMTYRWQGTYLLPGQNAVVHSKKVRSSAKPVLIYTNGGSSARADLICDTFISDGNDKRFHHWGQSISGMLSIMRGMHVEPCDWVVDPFVGGGATGVAALLSGAFFFGYGCRPELRGHRQGAPERCCSGDQGFQSSGLTSRAKSISSVSRDTLGWCLPFLNEPRPSRFSSERQRLG